MTRSPAPAPEPVTYILAVGSESVAGVRKKNEDCLGHFESRFGHVFLLADGMGGHEDGAIASSMVAAELPLALSEIADNARPDEALVQAIRTVNCRIAEKGRVNGSARGMGSTLAALLVRETSDGPVAIGAHVGDSRIYFLRGARLFCLTRDHTVVQHLLDLGSLTPSQAEDHPQASVLTRALGRSEAELTVDLTQWLLLKPGDTLLLCSDGLSGYADDTAIGKTLGRSTSCEQIARELVDLAMRSHSTDNISVLVVRVGHRTERLREGS